MRPLHRIVLASLGGALLAAPLASQRSDDQIHPRSIELMRQGETLLAGGKFVEADDALEAALTVDPRNRTAFVVMGRVAQKQRLFGQAIRFTNKALALEPRDLDALAVQGEAMVELGAVARAQQNLAKIKSLCGAKPCAPATNLSALIQRGPAMAKAETPAAAPKKN